MPPPFSLTIGTERANTLQNAIQDELMKRGFSPDADPVMAEYITIMIINNKTAAQITSELEDLIGPDFDASFTDWLFLEAAKGAPESEIPLTSSSSTAPSVAPAAAAPKAAATSEIPVHSPSNSVADHRRPLNSRAGAPGGAPLYQQALSSTLSHGQKRAASVRSPSPPGHGPSKTRRMEVPTGPRAMQSGGPRSDPGTGGGGRSLLDRVGGRNGAHPSYARGDEIQARIDAVTNGGMPTSGVAADPSMMMGFQNGVGMDMTAAGVNANTVMLQEIMMNQMALMAQMATSMGMLNPATGQMMGTGFPPGMQPGDMGMFQGGGTFGQGQAPAPAPAPAPAAQTTNGRGRGGSRGGRGRGGGGPGRGPVGGLSAPASEMPGSMQAHQMEPQGTAENAVSQAVEPSVPIVAPTPVAPSGQAAPGSQQPRIAYALPERPQSPTLCKFGTKCTNSQCRYSHPSPVATAESGVVLSEEACEKGKECKDKDCIKSHVSPAVNGGGAEVHHQQHQKASHPHGAPTYPSAPSSPIPCRFGASCTRANCAYSHPSRAQQCRFGAGCTRGTCPFQHPEGRVLPTTFHRGLSTNGPMVSVATPEIGSMGGSVHRSVTFNVSHKGEDVKEKLAKQMKELEATKKAVQDAEAAATKKTVLLEI